MVNKSTHDFKFYAKLTLKQAKRLIVLVVGVTILLLGVIMIITPGPASLFIPIGLAILGTEFLWAKNLLDRIKKSALSMKDKLYPTKPPNEKPDS